MENVHARITKGFIFHVDFIALGNVSSTDRPYLLFINCIINQTFTINYKDYVQPMQDVDKLI